MSHLLDVKDETSKVQHIPNKWIPFHQWETYVKTTELVRPCLQLQFWSQRHGHKWENQQRTMNVVQRQEHHSKGGLKSWCTSVWKREGSGISSMLKNTWREAGCTEDTERFFFSVSIVRRRCNGHEMKHWRVSLKIRRSFLHWHRLSRAVVEPPSMEIFKSYLDTLLNNQLWLTLLMPSIPAQVPSNLRHSVSIWKFSL